MAPDYAHAMSRIRTFLTTVNQATAIMVAARYLIVYYPKNSEQSSLDWVNQIIDVANRFRWFEDEITDESMTECTDPDTIQERLDGILSCFSIEDRPIMMLAAVMNRFINISRKEICDAFTDMLQELNPTLYDEDSTRTVFDWGSIEFYRKDPDFQEFLTRLMNILPESCSDSTIEERLTHTLYRHNMLSREWGKGRRVFLTKKGDGDLCLISVVYQDGAYIVHCTPTFLFPRRPRKGTEHEWIATHLADVDCQLYPHSDNSIIFESKEGILTFRSITTGLSDLYPSILSLINFEQHKGKQIRNMIDYYLEEYEETDSLPWPQ